MVYSFWIETKSQTFWFHTYPAPPVWGLILWGPKTREQCPEQWHCCVLSAVGTCYIGSHKLCFLVWWNKSCSYLDHQGFFEIFRRKGQGWMPLLFSLLSSKGSTKWDQALESEIGISWAKPYSAKRIYLYLYLYIPICWKLSINLVFFSLLGLI